MPVQRLVILVVTLWTGFAHADGSSSIMRISYASPGWNTDSKKVDSAFVVLREKSTGKLVTIQLEETEPDSSEFSGQFSISLPDIEKFQPEVYIPPQELRGHDPDNKKLLAMIQAGKLSRKPLILKRTSRGQTLVDVYDTRDQAESALKAYQEQQKLAQEMRRKKPLKPVTGDSAVAAAQAAERKAALDKLALEAAQHAQDRVRLEQIERQKAKEREEHERQLTEQERAARQEQARQVSAEALALYDQGNFKEAEGKFKQAVDLDPDNKDYFYKYGITLYRNQKFNDALVALKIAKVDASLELEKKYYIGLVYYRLGELDNAITSFSEVAKSNDPAMAPLSQFYLGVIQFAQEKYDPAKQSFEKVIDTAKDPRLDQQSEDYLDRISGAMAYQKMRENKWTAMGTLGLMYDSNVLLNPSNNQGTGMPTNSPDLRLLTLVDLQYRPIFNETHELAPHVTLNMTNSEKGTSAPADPWIYDVAVPYSYKHKNWKSTITPGYEWLVMAIDGSSTKTVAMNSYFLTWDNTFAMNKNWFSTYTVQYRRDNSLDPQGTDSVAGGTNPDNLSANLFTLRTSQTFLIDKARKQALIPTLDYMRNAAVGSNRTYNRYDLGLTYVRPLPWDLTWNVGFNYYRMVFPGTTGPNRLDKDYSVTTGVSKPVRDWVTWGLTGTYTVNNSTDVRYGYDKYLVLTTATFVTNF